MIYFLRDAPTGSIKIGYAKRDVRARMADLQTGNPSPLALLASISGTRKDEAELHRRFAANRVPLTREWFRPSEALLAYVASVRRGDPDAIVVGDVVRLLVPTFLGGWQGVGRVLFSDGNGFDLQKLCPSGVDREDTVTCCTYEVERVRDPRRFHRVPILLPEWLEESDDDTVEV